MTTTSQLRGTTRWWLRQWLWRKMFLWHQIGLFVYCTGVSTCGTSHQLHQDFLVTHVLSSNFQWDPSCRCEIIAILTFRPFGLKMLIYSTVLVFWRCDPLNEKQYEPYSTQHFDGPWQFYHNFARVYSYFCRKLPWKRYDEQQEKSFWPFGFALVSNPLNDLGMTVCNFLTSACSLGRGQYAGTSAALILYTLCLKIVPTFKLSVTLSNLNWSSKFLHC